MGGPGFFERSGEAASNSPPPETRQRRGRRPPPMMDLFERLRRSKVYDLAQPYFAGMPHFPTHPPFLFGLTKKHGEVVGPAGHSSAADAIAMGSHVGTHMDALCHFSCGGRLFGGEEVAEVQSYTGGLARH